MNEETNILLLLPVFDLTH